MKPAVSSETSPSKLRALVALAISGLLFPAYRVFGFAGYVVTRIVTQRKEGKSWSEVWADGAKPITGSIWLDGAVFLAILLAVMGILWLVMR